MHGQSHTDRERELATLAKRQHGVVSRRQLTALGIGRGAIDARLRLSRLHPIHRGVYAVGHAPLSLRARWMAAVLAYGDEAVLSHQSAAALWGLMRPKSLPIDVTSHRGRPGRSGIRLHRSHLAEDERAVEAGIPVTSVPRTLLDLAGVVGEQPLARAFEEADRLKLLRMPALERICTQAGKRKAWLLFAVSSMPPRHRSSPVRHWRTASPSSTETTLPTCQNQ